MMKTFSLCILFAIIQTQESPKPPPLSKNQLERLQKLVRKAQARAVALKKSLAEKQSELTDAYTQYDLDIAKVEQLHKAILQLQKELLLNYHTLHVQLRSIVGEPRFQVLRQRLDRVMGLENRSGSESRK